jgi:hypothetical protein
MNPISTLAKLRALLAREAPEQADVIRDALRQTAQTGREHSVVGLASEGGPSVITRGTVDRVTPNAFDLKAARRAPGNPQIIDFHTHPSREAFVVQPSQDDLTFYSTNYPAGRELRTLIASHPERLDPRSRAAYNFFATDNPAQVLSPLAFTNARKELQFAARPKGPLRSIQDDPILREYLDSGGDVGALLDDSSSLLFMRYLANKGVGRHEMELGGRQAAPNPSVTDTELFRRMEGPALEFLKSKKFKQGGAVRSPLNHMKECSCHG